MRHYYVDFNYDKLLEDIKKSEFSMRQISLIIGKSQGFLDQAMRNKRVNAETVKGSSKQEVHEFINRYSNTNKDKDIKTLIMELSYQVQSMNKKMVEILEYVKKEDLKNMSPFD